MAGESDIHRSILEALNLRVGQLYPEAERSLGKRHQTSGLKPDLLVKHPDGRTWAFEIVFGNHSPRHLRENHTRYAAAGVSDYWLVWEKLGPKSPRRSQPPLAQSRMWNAMETYERYPLNQLQRRILEAQAGPVRWLYTFAVDVPELAGPRNPFFSLHLIGLEAFRVESWQGEETATVTSEWIPLPELGFAEDGRPQALHAWSDFERFTAMQALGLDPNDPLSVPDLTEQLNALTGTTDGLARLGSVNVLLQAQKLLSEEEQASFLLELQSATTDWMQGFEDLQTPALSDDSLSDANRLEESVAKLDRVHQWLTTAPLPPLVRRVLAACIENSDIPYLAEQLRWQAVNPRLAMARSRKPESSQKQRPT